MVLCSHLVLVGYLLMLKTAVVVKGSSCFGFRGYLKVMLRLSYSASYFILCQSGIGHKLVIEDFPSYIKKF